MVRAEFIPSLRFHMRVGDKVVCGKGADYSNSSNRWEGVDCEKCLEKRCMVCGGHGWVWKKVGATLRQAGCSCRKRGKVKA